MAEKIVSPGVFTRENDLSFLAQGVGEIGAAFIGPFKQGPAFVPTIVRTQSEFEDIFGTPDGTYYTEYAVQNYLREAGQATIVRVAGIGGYQQLAPLAIFASGSNRDTQAKLVGVLHSTNVGNEGVGFPSTTLTPNFASIGSFVISSSAVALNISASTVSRALRNHSDISEAVTEKVIKMAKKMNYKANITAQNLKERKTKVIGVIIPEILHHFNMSVLNGIEEVAFRKGFHLLIAKTNESYQREIMHTDSLVGQVDGLLVCLSQETKKFDHFKAFKQHEIPLVFFERVAEKVAGHKVIMNDEATAFARLVRASPVLAKFTTREFG